MAPPVIRSIGRLRVGDVNDQDDMVVDMPSRKPGDILFIFAFGVTVFSNNGGIPETPPGFEVLYTFDDTSTFGLWIAGRVYDPDAQITLTRGAGQNVGFWSTQAWSVTNVTPNTTWYDEVDDRIVFTLDTTDAVVVAGADRMVQHFFYLFQFNEHPGQVTSVDGGYTLYPGRSANRVGCFIHEDWATKVTDTNEPVREYVVDGSSSDRIFAVSIIGADQSLLPAIPQPNRLSLDCARNYTVFVTDVDYETRIDRIYCDTIHWERVLDEVSPAQVTVPDVYGGLRCCVPFGGIEPWRFGLLIERNDAEVWRGAVTAVQRDPNAGMTTLRGSDVMVRMARRFATRTDIVDWKDTDAGVAFFEVLNETALLSSDPWFLNAPKVFTGSTVTRKLLPRKFEMAASVIGELAESAIDYFIMNGVLYVWEPGLGWQYINRGPRDSSRVGALAAQIGFNAHKATLDGPYNVNFDFVYGLFTEAAFATLPRWGVDGMNQTNFVVIAGADQGEFGAREYFSAENGDSQSRYGVLDHVEPNPLRLAGDQPPAQANAALQAHANTYMDLHALAPVTVEGGVLAQGAPIDVDNLRPGSLWGLDIYDRCYGQLLTMGRLKRVAVDVSYRDGVLDEQISPTLYPPGFEGGEAV